MTSKMSCSKCYISITSLMYELPSMQNGTFLEVLWYVYSLFLTNKYLILLFINVLDQSSNSTEFS